HPAGLDNTAYTLYTRMSGYRLEFYRDESGHEPALEYIRSQTKDHRTKIGRALRSLQELGYMARRPLVEYLGDGIYELRAPLVHHQHRLFYFFRGRTVIAISHGYLKYEAVVPDIELERARRYRTNWLNQFGGEA